MSYVTSSIKYPMNQWNKSSIRPGPVGSVGDVLTSVRIKQSLPDMAIAYDKKFNPQNSTKRGSNVQDGQYFSYSNDGSGAQVKKQKLSRNSSFKTTTGWYHQDIIAPDRYVEPKQLPLGNSGYNTQVAQILSKQGTAFQELPGGYAPPPNTLLRGNNYPRVVNGLVDSSSTSNLPNSIIMPSSEQMSKIAKPVSYTNPLFVKVKTE